MVSSVSGILAAGAAALGGAPSGSPPYSKMSDIAKGMASVLGGGGSEMNNLVSTTFDSGNKGADWTISNGLYSDVFGASTRATKGTAGWQTIGLTNGKTTGKWVVETLLMGSNYGSGGSHIQGFSDHTINYSSDLGAGASIGFGLYMAVSGNHTFAAGGTGATLNTTIAAMTARYQRWTWAIDIDAKKVWLAVNGTWVYGDPNTGVNPLITFTASGKTWYPACSSYNAGNNQIDICPVVGTRPVGFLPWAP